MVYTRIDNRTAYYNNLYKDKQFTVQDFNKDGTPYFRAVAPNGKKIGPDFKTNAPAHKLVAKLFPTKFNPPEGYTSGTSRLIPTTKRNPVRNMKASDFADIGITKKEAYRISKELKKNNLLVSQDPADIKKMMTIFNSAQKRKEDVATKRIAKALRSVVGQFETRHLPGYKKFQDSTLFHPKFSTNNFRMFVKFLKPRLEYEIKMFLSSHKSGLKFEYNQNVKYYVTRINQETGQSERVETNAYFTSSSDPDGIEDIGPILVQNTSGVRLAVNKAVARVEAQIDKFIWKGSGWNISKFDVAFINQVEVNPIWGGSYVELPEWIANKKACVNIKNTDNKCFLDAIICALHYDEIKQSNKNVNRPSTYKPFHELYPNLNEVDCDVFRNETMESFISEFPQLKDSDSDLPMTVNFTDKMNKYEDIVARNIHVWFTDCKALNKEKKGTIRPLRDGSRRYEKSIVLLLLHEDGKNHFVWVRSPSALLVGGINKHTGKTYFCTRCLARYYSQEKLDLHYELCKNNAVTTTSLPKVEDAILKFKKVVAQLKLPFVIYPDFEASLVSDYKEKTKTTKRHNTHEINSAHYVIVSDVGEKPNGERYRLDRGRIIKRFFYRGEDAVEKFLDQLAKDCEELYFKYFHNQVKEHHTPEEEEQFKNETHCHICGNDNFVENKDTDKKVHPLSAVFDHDHLTGKFRGKAHSECNIKLQIKKVFPVFFHNARGYDSHFVIKKIKEAHAKRIKVIAVNKEKFTSFSLFTRYKQGGRTVRYETRFLDSCCFLNSSLEKLAESLEPKDFHHTMDFVRSYSEKLGVSDPQKVFKMFTLLKKKGVYPYEWVTSSEVFSRTKLPEKEKFVSQLSHETKFYDCLSDKQKEELDQDYTHAQQVWSAFKCQTFGDYHDLYLYTDVCLLADVFENFRKVSLCKLNLDPCHYYTLPALGFDAMLKATGVRIELFDNTQRDMYLLMEQAKIGGISGTGGLRHVKLNNKYIPKTYDPSKPSTYAMYVDANSLYAWAMSQKLPIGDFSWEENNDLNDVDRYLKYVFSNLVDGHRSCFLEVDATIPKDLHDYFNDYCPFPENIEVKSEMLSKWQKDTAEMLKGADCLVSSGVKKLTPNLLDKKKYTVHAKTLKLWCELGCKVTKIHRVLKFRQEAWLKDFIDKCATERKNAKTEFEKDFWKLIPNSNYGKTLEDVRRRVDIRLVNSEEQLKKLVNKPTLKSVPTKVNDNGLMMVDMAKTAITLDKPIHVGIAVLNLSKLLMYNFWYKVLKAKYGDKIRLVYTDTDSFIFVVETEDFYKDLGEDKELGSYFDFSSYPEGHPLYSTANKKKLGFFKDETNGDPVAEVVAVRAKMYSVLTKSGIQKNTGKGIKKCILKKTGHDKYKKCLQHESDPKNFVQRETMTFIRSNTHNVTTETTVKQTLTPYDDKKYVLRDGNHQLSYGHWRIKKHEASDFLLEVGRRALEVSA